MHWAVWRIFLSSILAMIVLVAGVHVPIDLVLVYAEHSVGKIETRYGVLSAE